MEGFDPKRRWHARLKTKYANNIVHHTNNTFRLAVLLGGVWTRKPKVDAAGGSELVESTVVKFTTVVALDGEKNSGELSSNICMKIG